MSFYLTESAPVRLRNAQDISLFGLWRLSISIPRTDFPKTSNVCNNLRDGFKIQVNQVKCKQALNVMKPLSLLKF